MTSETDPAGSSRFSSLRKWLRPRRGPKATDHSSVCGKDQGETSRRSVEVPCDKKTSLSPLEYSLRQVWTPDMLRKLLPWPQSRRNLALISRAAYSDVMPSISSLSGSHLSRMIQPGYDLSKIVTLPGVNSTHFKSFGHAFPLMTSLKSVELASSGKSIYGDARPDSLQITRGGPDTKPHITMIDNSVHRTRFDVNGGTDRLYGELDPVCDFTTTDFSSERKLLAPVTIAYVLDLTPDTSVEGVFASAASLDPIRPSAKRTYGPYSSIETRPRSIICNPVGYRKARQHGLTNDRLTSDVIAAMSLAGDHMRLDDIFVPLQLCNSQSLREFALAVSSSGAHIRHLNLTHVDTEGESNTNTAGPLSSVLGCEAFWKIAASHVTIPVSELDIGGKPRRLSLHPSTELITFTIPRSQRAPPEGDLAAFLSQCSSRAIFRLSYSGAERDDVAFRRYNPALQALRYTTLGIYD